MSQNKAWEAMNSYYYYFQFSTCFAETWIEFISQATNFDDQQTRYGCFSSVQKWSNFPNCIEAMWFSFTFQSYCSLLSFSPCNFRGLLRTHQVPTTKQDNEAITDKKPSLSCMYLHAPFIFCMQNGPLPYYYYSPILALHYSFQQPNPFMVCYSCG